MHTRSFSAMAALLSASAGVFAQSTLTPLQPGPGRTTSQGLCLSPDGSTVGGLCSGGFLTEATIWSDNGLSTSVPGDLLSPPLNAIHALTNPNILNLAQAAGGSVSRVVSGPSGSFVSSSAARWSSVQGWEILDPSFSLETSLASGISADGQVLVGYGGPAVGGADRTAFRWSQIDGLSVLPSFSENFPHRLAVGVSANGMIVCGAASTPDASEEAVVWENGVLRRLGFAVASGDRTSAATCLTPDGLLCAGVSTGPTGRKEATIFRLSGAVALGILPAATGPNSSRANAISRDGVIVAGQTGTPETVHAFIWDAGHGMRDLNMVAASLPGVDMAGWTLKSVQSLSEDGTTLTGSGVYNGVLQGYRLNVPCFVAPAVLSSPAATCGAAGRNVTLSAIATRHGALSYQWRLGGVSLNDGPTAAGTIVAGAQTAELHLTNLRPGDAGLFDCMISNPCGEAITTPAQVGACAADFNCSGTLSVQDIFDFLGAWFAGDPRADINTQAGITVQDIFDFLNSWFSGC